MAVKKNPEETKVENGATTTELAPSTAATQENVNNVQEAEKVSLFRKAKDKYNKAKETKIGKVAINTTKAVLGAAALCVAYKIGKDSNETIEASDMDVFNYFEKTAGENGDTVEVDVEII